MWLCGSAGLPAEVLADMVMANMSHLPSREEVVPASAGSQPAAPSGLSGLVQVCPNSHFWPCRMHLMSSWLT